MVRGARKIKLRELVKSVRILPTGTQFNGSSPANITLKALAVGFVPTAYEWYKGTGTAVVDTSQNFIIANSQVSAVETYKVIVKNNQGQSFEDTISITKVTDGNQGVPGKLPIQREWKTGDVYRNNDSVIDYIYHRATNTWWRLKDGYNNVTAQINPTIEFVQLNSLEQLAVNLLIAENANIAGFVFKDGKMVSQLPSLTNPYLVLDGGNGHLEARRGRIGSFEIDDDGLYYKDYGFKNIGGMLYPYKNDFLINTNGFKVTSDDLYSGSWCFENSIGQPFCSSQNNARVTWSVETGSEHYAVRIKMEGMYSWENHKGSLWVTGIAHSIPAILIDKGGLEISDGDLLIAKGHAYLNDGSLTLNNGDISVESGFIKANRAILAGLQVNTVSVNSDTTISSEIAVFAYNTTGSITIKLPANPPIGRRIEIKRTGAGAVVVDGNGKNIQRSATTSTYTIPTVGDMVMLTYAGTNWQMNKIGV